jgi:hypothetical protein
MTRTSIVAALGSVLLLGLLGVWFLGGPGPDGPALPATTARESATGVLKLDDLMGQLQIVPLAGQPAPSFTLETLDGARLGLADLGGRPAFLYFWATW